MKVKLSTSRSTPDGVHDAGEIIDLPAEEAKRLLESGQAEPVAVKRAQRAEKR
ncbi:MAG: hypothetical protein KDB58_08895 [Solirubrobacterales bacterium]|nr:hypothetical protein [Solirubrobacterales bacterium]